MAVAIGVCCCTGIAVAVAIGTCCCTGVAVAVAIGVCCCTGMALAVGIGISVPASAIGDAAVATSLSDAQRDMVRTYF